MMVGTFNFTNHGSVEGLVVGDHAHVTIGTSERVQRVEELTGQLLELMEQRSMAALPPVEYARIQQQAAEIRVTAKAAAGDERAGPHIANLCERLLSSLRKFGDAHEGVASCLSLIVALWPMAKAVAGVSTPG